MSKSNGSFMPLYLTHSYKNRTVNQQKKYNNYINKMKKPLSLPWAITRNQTPRELNILRKLHAVNSEEFKKLSAEYFNIINTERKQYEENQKVHKANKSNNSNNNSNNNNTRKAKRRKSSHP
jgi:hypothetical protein